MKFGITSLGLALAAGGELIGLVLGIHEDTMRSREKLEREIESERDLRWNKDVRFLGGDNYRWKKDGLLLRGGVNLRRSKDDKSLHAGGILNHKKNHEIINSWKVDDRAAPLTEDNANMEDLQLGYIGLSGMTPAQQKRELNMRPLFEFTEATDTRNGLPIYPQFERMDSYAHCDVRSQENSFSWSTGSSFLSAQTSESSTGFDQSTDLSVSIPVESASVSASTTIRNAMVLGNSEESSSSFSERNRGNTHSVQESKLQETFLATINYDTMDSWTTGFKDACNALGNSPSDEDVLRFFRRYGTHGLKKGVFGKKCTAMVFTEGGRTESSYQDTSSETSSREFSFLWFSHSSQETSSTDNQGSSTNEFTNGRSHLQCTGASTGTNCGISADSADNPAIIDWEYKPIWEMNVPGLTSGAKQNLQEVFEKLVQASVDCMQQNCNNSGACAPNKQKWRSTYNIDRYDEYFQRNKCFCFDNIQGNQCDDTRGVALQGPQRTRDYQNSWDGPFDYNTVGAKPICGVYSVHSNHHEDRRFKFDTCRIAEQGYSQPKPSSPTSTSYTSYDREFIRECPANAIMTGLQSNHHNHYEDRRFRLHCTQYQNVVVGNCDEYPSSWENSFDQVLDFQCSQGKAIKGIRSYHANHQEDRRFKFKCCELKVENPNMA